MNTYKKIEIWKQRGFIDDKLDVDTKIKLGDNLQYGKDIVMCKKILTDDFDFYKEIESLLYPIIVYYTIKMNGIGYKDKNIIQEFIMFCETNLRTKYNLEKYDDDYLLIMDFIKTHS